MSVAARILALSLGLWAVNGGANDDLKIMKQNDMKPYAPAEAGFERQVIRLEAHPEENDLMVEIMVGKTMQVDCNRMAFAGTLEEHTVEGWGYPYYQLPEVGGPMGTLMACPEDSIHAAFVTVHGEGFRLRYNSRLPLVVYVPKGFEVRYRIWTAGSEVREARVE